MPMEFFEYRSIALKRFYAVYIIIGTFLTTIQMASTKCSGIPTIDLIQFAVPSLHNLPDGVKVLYDHQTHVHGFQFSPKAQPISIKANVIFQQCVYFPYEFSFFITYKKEIISKKEQCIFSLIHQESKAILMSIGLSKDRIIFRYEKDIYTFRMTQDYQDKEWHSLGISMASTVLAVMWDCHFRREKSLVFRFPNMLSIVNTSFTIGRCSLQSSTFQGLLKSILLLPGRDATILACSSRQPYHDELTTGIASIVSHSIGDTACIWSDVGKIAYDTQSELLKVCVNGLWKDIQQKKERKKLDYLVSHQILEGGEGSLDVEIFHLPEVGTFAVFALSDLQGFISKRSIVYKWTRGRFKFYQWLPTFSAQSIEYFVINYQYFIAIANYGSSSSDPTNSTIFKWNKSLRLFQPFQNILTFTARDVEAFQIDGNHYLAIANHAKGDNTMINSIIYKWSWKYNQFVHHQAVPTVGAYDWTYFKVDGYHFLAVANAFTGLSTLVFSVIYIWQDEKWLQFQTMETNGATDWEYFAFNNEHFLVVANAYNYGSQNFRNIESYRTNSTIYKLDKKKRIFQRYQTINTNSAVDWEHLSIGDDQYLMVSNAQNGGSDDRLRSVMYRWKGLDKFVPIHSLYTQPNTDIEVFKEDKDFFIIFANIKGSSGEVVKIKFV